MGGGGGRQFFGVAGGGRWDTWASTQKPLLAGGFLGLSATATDTVLFQAVHEGFRFMRPPESI